MTVEEAIYQRRSIRKFQKRAVDKADLLQLAAVERGLSTCALGSFQKESLCGLLGLPKSLWPELVIAVGYGGHESRIVPYVDTVKYRQESDGTFCVPKLSLSEVLVYEE